MNLTNRREHSRSVLKMPVTCRILDSDRKPILAREFECHTIDTSPGGILLAWSRWWKCKGCAHLRNWDNDRTCKLAKCPFGETDVFLIKDSVVEVIIHSPDIVRQRLERIAHVVWAREQKTEDEYSYQVGLRFARGFLPEHR